MSSQDTRRLLLYGAAFLMPGFTALFLLTGPHDQPWLWLVPVAVVSVWDLSAAPERRPPLEVPGWPFELALWLLSGLQLLNTALLWRVFADQGFFGAHTVPTLFLVGTSSAVSAIVVSHELIHRPQRPLRLLGRLLLCTVMYEHFATEHVRGHHRRLGTEEDPATARFGETLWAFVGRTVWAQLRSAWTLENRRLGVSKARALGLGLWRHRGAQGLAVSWGGLALLVVLLGPLVGLAHLLQASWAVLILEVVNYIEHWGLVRRGRRVTTVDSWDSEGWLTYYTLVGLSRHADHHAHAARPYQQLRHVEESPKMPWGYWGTAWTALLANGVFRRAYAQELRRRGLGPFQPS